MGEQDPKQAQPRVRVSADKQQAHLLVPPTFSRSWLTPEFCRSLCVEAGVQFTTEVQQAIDSLLAQLPPEGQAVEALIAQATAPQHGRDAQVQWLVQEPSQVCQDTSFYDRSAFVMVRHGQVLGQVTPATAGEDGRDVTGHILAAIAGKPPPLTTDDSILLDAQQRLVAQADGILIRQHDKAGISQVLEVSNDVDFSTGNIDFTGNVVIRGHIGDRFTVRAGGSVQVSGVIEAAEIYCGGDLVASGGMAGRQSGRLQVGGNLIVRFLDAVTASVKGDLRLEREAIGSQIVVHGQIDSPTGSIIGGVLVPTGAVRIATLGSPAGNATQIIVGRVPRLQTLLVKMQKMQQKVIHQHKKLIKEQSELELNRHRLKPQQRERMTEIIFEIQRFAAYSEQLSASIEAMQEQIRKQRRVHLAIERTLHQGVLIQTESCEWRVFDDVSGPLCIDSNEHGELVFRRHNGPQQPINVIARASLGDQSTAA